jgi:hypothetical protein
LLAFRFPPEVIVVAVRWYLRFGLSYRDVEELLTERGVEVDHVTVDRWVLRFTPLLAEATRPCRHAMGSHWQVDRPISRWLAAGGMYRALPDLRCSAHPAKFLNPTSPGPNDCDEDLKDVVEVGTTAEGGCGPGGYGPAMEIITIYNPRRRRVAVQRHPDHPPRRLVILAGWGMADADLLRAVRPLLEPEEIATVTRALGLEHRQDPQP